MGSFFGGLLAENGLDVVLVDVWAEHVDNINKNGLRIVGVGGDRQAIFREFRSYFLRFTKVGTIPEGDGVI